MKYVNDELIAVSVPKKIELNRLAPSRAYRKSKWVPHEQQVTANMAFA
jgi:hypothetical protein